MSNSSFIELFLNINVETSYFTQLKMCCLMTTFRCPWHLDHVLIVYSSMEHVTWKSPGPMCGWVGSILHPYSIHAHQCLPDLKYLFYPSGLSLCFSVDHFCHLPVDNMVLFHGMVCDGWFVSYTALPCPGGSGLCTSCERVHFFLVFLDPQTELPACLSNVFICDRTEF